MGNPIPVDQPWQLQHPPEMWEQILQQALADHRANPGDAEAMAAIRDANEALSVYDQAAAASPGERISSGVTEGLSGLGEAALDIPRGIESAVLHPIETVKNLPKLPGQLLAGLKPEAGAEQTARTVGNLGALLAPAAKTSSKGSTVAAIGSEAAKAPLRSIAAMLKRPQLRNAILEEQLKALRGANAEEIPAIQEAMEAPPAFPGESVQSIPGTKGLEVTGTRAPRAAKPAGNFSLEEAQALTRRLEAARAKASTHTAESILPQMQEIGTGAESITPEALAKTQWIGTPAFEEALPIMSPSRLIGPAATDAEINAFIKSILKAQQKGYQ